MNRVLVTGATGFIGRHTLEPLRQLGYEVHAASSSDHLSDDSNIHWHTLDLLQGDGIGRVMRLVKPTHLLHLAWDTTPGKYSISTENLHWVKASLNLLEAFVEQGGRRVVFAGSCAEYDWDYGVCIENKTPCSPRTLYGHSKQSVQQIASSFCQQQQISFAQGRVFYLFGPHEHSARFVPQVINGLLSQKNTDCSEGLQLRDFLYVKDVASAFVSLLDSPVKGVVNIASGMPHSLRQLVEIITQFTGNAEVIQFGELATAENEPEILLANTSRLTKEVKWQAEYSMEQALKETVDWWRLCQ